jgi:hypothetical protein
MSEIHIGPHTELRHAHQEPPEHPERFDREINLRGIFWTVAGLVAVAIVVHILMWYLLAGFHGFDERRDPEPLPLREANVQPPPPEPRLQTAPEADLGKMRAEEDKLLGKIDEAMDVIAARGLAPEVVGGQPGAWTGGAVPPAQQTVAPGAMSPSPPGPLSQPHSRPPGEGEKKERTATGDRF